MWICRHEELRMTRILSMKGNGMKRWRRPKMLCSIVPFPELVFRACREIRSRSRQWPQAQPFIRRPFSWPPFSDQVSALSWIPPHYHASGPPPRAHTSALPRRSGRCRSCRPRTSCPPCLGSSPSSSRCSCTANHPDPPASPSPARPRRPRRTRSLLARQGHPTCRVCVLRRGSPTPHRPSPARP